MKNSAGINFPSAVKAELGKNGPPGPPPSSSMRAGGSRGLLIRSNVEGFFRRKRKEPVESKKETARTDAIAGRIHRSSGNSGARALLKRGDQALAPQEAGCRPPKK